MNIFYWKRFQTIHKKRQHQVVRERDEEICYRKGYVEWKIGFDVKRWWEECLWKFKDPTRTFKLSNKKIYPKISILPSWRSTAAMSFLLIELCSCCFHTCKLLPFCIVTRVKIVNLPSKTMRVGLVAGLQPMFEKISFIFIP